MIWERQVWSIGGVTFPTVFEEKAGIAFEAITVNGVRSVYYVEENIVEEGLEGGDRGALDDKEAREGIGSGNTKGEDLTVFCFLATISTSIGSMGTAHTQAVAQHKSP